MQLYNRVIVAAGQHQSGAQVCIDDERKGVKLDRTSFLFNRFIKSANCRQQSVSVPMMSRRIVGIELDGAFKLGF